MMITRTHLITVACLLFLSPQVLAGPPFVTDDPEPVAEHGWEVNYAVSKSWEPHAASVAMPAIDINYGFTSDIQLHAQPRYSYERDGHQHEYGIDNTEVGVKYRFFHQTVDGKEFMLGIYPLLQLPTGNRHLGDARGRTQWFLPLWGQLNTENWTLYGGGGYRINQYANSKNSWFTGATVLYNVSHSLRLGGEMFNESATEQEGKHVAGFNLGGIYNLSPDYAILFSAGKALNNLSENYKLSTYIALQVIY
ncbi:transporter [Methylovorus sp. MP688]|uniref:transporter n=1 Tax=Methylovorus sp. (strain MP688) TaxID=887061 RepID=UPI001EE674F4|nr:transporter [Methylovorus sp. MP688]